MSGRDWDDTLMQITYWTAITVAVVVMVIIVVVMLMRWFP